MPTAFVFYLPEGVVTSSLELMRRIAQPLSTSLPHVTVRYPVDLLSAADLSMYETTTVDRLEIVKPGTFSVAESVDAELSTVFLKCGSEILEPLSYKPLYPDSIFHLSLYDGKPSSFAADILDLLEQFPWHLSVRFPPATLTRIPIKHTGPKRKNEHVRLSNGAALLLRELAGEVMQPDALLDVSTNDRLKLIYRLAESLHSDVMKTAAVKSSTGGSSSVTAGRRRPSAVQPDLWGEVSVEGDGRGDALLSRSARRSVSEGHRPIGLFLTPPELAQDLVAEALKAHSARYAIDFGDPAIGSGIFFASLLRNVDPTRIRSAVGVELDESRAEITANRWSERNLTVLSGTFPDVDVDSGTRSLVVANPPYVRSQSLDPIMARRWRSKIYEDVDVRLGGRADLYVYMILACHRWLAPGGVAVWLLPSEFAQTQYGAALRSYLTTNVQLLRVHSYDSAHPLFENARVSSTAVLFQNRQPDANGSIKFSDGGTLAQPTRTRSVGNSELARMAKWGAHVWLPERRRASSVKLGQLFKVRRGIATGANGRFVLSTRVVADLEIPQNWIKPVVPKTRMLRSDVIEALANGDPDVDAVSWLIDCDVPLSTIARKSPRFEAYLRSIEDEVMMSRLVQSRKPFYSQEQHSPSPFLFSSMSRNNAAAGRGPFYLNRSRAVNLNNYHSLYPRFSLDSLKEVGLGDLDVLRILCDIENDEFTREGRVYVSGLRKVEPRELPEIRLRSVPTSLLRLLGLGSETHSKA